MEKRNVQKRVLSAVLSMLLIIGAVLPAFFAGMRKVNAAEITSITYQHKNIVLSDSVLYVDAALQQSGQYSFKTLQEAVAAAKPGTKGNPTVIYLAPDVYWTDDYTKTEDRASTDLIGLIIDKPYISLIGMTGNPEDVVIASDRGQNAGADGNFNTIGVGDGFHAKDLTIGNYCNIDLKFPLDASKNHKKRQESITQAQAVTKAPGLQDIDEWFFEHCNIVSRLNLFSRDERPDRALYKDCHMECTDDSLGTGYISVFLNCDFDLYSNTPCGGASFYMQSYLGCEFTTHLSDNKTITLCKNTKPFTFIDCEFKGDMTGMEWKPSNLSNDLRQIVYNNTLNGQPLIISPSAPDLSVTPDAEQLKAFKNGDEYNVYNMLNNAGYEEWDPLGQKDSMPVGTWNVQFEYEGITKDVAPVLQGNMEDSLVVTPIVLGGTDKTIQWSTLDDKLWITPQADGTVIVKAKNETVENVTGCLIAKAANGMEKVLHFTITPEITEGPIFTQSPVIQAPEDGKVAVKYTIADKGNGSVDISKVNWYRASDASGSDKLLIAQTTYVEENAVPYALYTLRPEDIGYYIIAEVIPQDSTSIAGTAMLTEASMQIKKEDVAEAQFNEYHIDLEHLAYISAKNDTAEKQYEWLTPMKSGNWYGGFYLPAEYREGGIWQDKAYLPAEGEDPYTYAAGASGALNTFGLQTTTQGARLVYVDDTKRKEMKLELTLSPHKTGAQGFGSAKQFMDIYFKYDAKTMTGYGLRIARMPEIEDPALASYAAKSCTFTLMKYVEGIAEPISESVVSTAFLPGCSVVIELKGNDLTADVTTTTAQESEYPEQMAHEVHLKHTFAEEEINLYSGIGLQHTGTSGAGKSGNRVTIHSMDVTYGDIIGESVIEDETETGNETETDTANDTANDTSDGEDSDTIVSTGDSSDLFWFVMWMTLSCCILGTAVMKSVYTKINIKQ